MTSQERGNGALGSALPPFGHGSPFGVITVDDAGRVLEWQAEPILGRTPSECVGLPLLQLLLPENEPSSTAGVQLKAALEMDAGHHTASLDVVVGTSRVPVMLYLTTLCSLPQAVRMVLVRRMVDDVAEQEMRIAQERVAALRRLTVAVGHELSNPLSFILNFGQFNEEVAQEIREAAFAYGQNPSDTGRRMLNDLTEDLFESTEISMQHTKRIEFIVKSLLSYVEVYGDRRLVTDINALVLATLDEIEAAPAPIVELDSRPLLASVNPPGIRRAIAAVLSNALEAVAERDADREEPPTVELATFLRDDEIEIRVCDSGQGMTPEARARILEPFFTTRSGREGAGLGLTVTEMILRFHGGRLEIDSQPGIGTTVSMALPARATF